MRETWRQSPLAPPEIWVSNLGNVRTEAYMATYMHKGVVRTQLKKPRKMSPWVSRNGYYTISVQRGPERVKYLLHRLVASAFVPCPDILLSVNHKNCNKLDNRASNLEWCTLAENTKMQWRDGLVDLRGERAPGAKLTEESVLKIIQSETEYSAAALAKIYGVSDALIYKIWSGKRWKHLR